MKYRDLIQFEPVESVAILKKANDPAEAEKFVSTYVISDRMADVLLHKIRPHLDLENLDEGGGLFIVGNYGTGKSHLMAVVSAVAENADLAAKLTHLAVAEGMGAISGRYQVIRQEFGTSKMTLRDVVVQYLEEGLAAKGVTYKFPALEAAPNTKDSLAEMMAAFEEKYPDQGLLVVIDELLDFLRGRRERELFSDLGFLREVGEICQHTRLRFIAGLQESLFDSPMFQFAASSIQRVKDRFEQVRIVREDVAYVVSRRLLSKTQAQRARIRDHLERFSTLYDSLSQNMESFVELFPVHPAYLEVFDQVTVIEKRQVLKALSQEMRALLDREVPDDQPGLISFDAYWELIKGDVAYRSVPEIRTVLERSQVLDDRIKNALAMPAYLPAAYRVLNALALHRISTTSLKAPIGLTALELRDRLCLSIPIPEQDSGFLLLSIENLMVQILKTVSGQFISKNAENGQYYLDLDKITDYEANIRLRIEKLGPEDLDRAYFDVLAGVLELTDSVYVPSFRIWQRELPWPAHGMTRLGYVFLGAPNERSTAQPPRDFYLHFLSYFNGGETPGPGERDEVYFVLTKQAEDVIEPLKFFAGATSLAGLSTQDDRMQYLNKAESYRAAFNRWLIENFNRLFQVHYQGETFTPSELIGKHRLTARDANIRDQVYQLAAACLDDHWTAKYPDYPKFSGTTFTTQNLAQAADAAIRAIAGGAPTRTAQTILEALDLAFAESGQLKYATENSQYAKHVIEKLNSLPPDKVLNRGELIEGSVDVEKRFGLELPLLAVVLTALVRQGDITLNLYGKRIDSDDLNEAARLGAEELAKFTSISRPKELPERALRELFSHLGIVEGLITDPGKHELAVQQLQVAVQKELGEAALAVESLRERPLYWNEPFMTEDEWAAERSAITEYKQFLDGLQYFTTPGRLRSFKHGVGEVKQVMKTRQTLQGLQARNDLLHALDGRLRYSYEAQIQLPQGHPWHQLMLALQGKQIALLKDPARRTSASVRATLADGLSDLQKAYASAYIEMHKTARLDTQADRRKQRLVKDHRWGQLRGLSKLELLPSPELEKLEARLNELHSCPGVGEADLRTKSLCPQCGYEPRADGSGGKSAAVRLDEVENDFEALYTTWTATLRTNLQQESQQENIKMLKDDQRKAVVDFIESGELPEKLGYGFVGALEDALKGLKKVVFSGEDLLLALTQAGMPCTIDELHDRFLKYITGQTAGKSPDKTRIQIDW